MKPQSKLRPLELWLIGLLALGLVICSWRGWIPYALTETLGFVTGAACVYLVVREHIWNFPLGIANNVAFFVLFYSSRLYGDACLQVVYLGLAAHGWRCWLHGGEDRAPRKIGHAPPRLLATLAVLVALGTASMIMGLRAAGGSAPVLDAFTTVLSLAAQWLLNRKAIETWYVWITADVLYIYLYVTRGLHLTAVLYAVFLGLCIAGLWAWSRTLTAGKVASVGEGAG
ncbi:MAG: nicotinamide riboside transporter PnuC [Actinomycetota bacterium]